MKQILLTCIALAAPQMLLAQETSNDIIVTASRDPHRARSPAIILDREAIDERAPAAIADLFRSITGVSVRVNSRGESVVRVRGAEERQTTVFLDGAPLATPWDGRVDLGLLPAGLIGAIEIVKGASPLEYGANTVGGVIDLRTVTAGDRLRVQAEAQVGTFGTINASALASLPVGEKFSVVAGFGLLKRDAERIAAPSSVPFDPTVSRRRTNTDLSARSLFVAGGYEAGQLELRLSLLNANVERGIAAQSDLDPAVSAPRFWRYPDWRLTQATGALRWHLSDSATLRVTGWRQWFDQIIDAYRDARYTALRSREDGSDRTWGARAVLAVDIGTTTLRLSGNAQTSTHGQIDSRTTTGLARDYIASPALVFRQRLVSGGVEVDHKFSDDLKTTIGVSIDHAETPLTGDKPAQPSSTSLGFLGTLRWAALPTLDVAVSLGRRNRFPSPRELFGESLGRFLANVDLRPERALLGDLTVAWQPSDMFNVSSTAWFANADDVVSQRIVRVATLNRRQRFNARGSFSYGLETTITTHLTSNLRAELNLALQDGTSKRESDGSRQALLRRPGRQITAALDWNVVEALDLRAELQNISSAVDLADTGSITRLPSATSLNLRAFWQVAKVKALGKITLTASLDNATDALILPQLGLPAPGRTFRLGIRLTP
jgi:iron complex outermembrane recepter protein